MDEPVSVVSDVSEIYPQDAVPTQRQRLANIVNAFAEAYGKQPIFMSRSPGRVNIIGEHIDYSLYDVLPMAIVADVLIAVATTDPGSGSDSSIAIQNIDSTKFKTGEFELPRNEDVPIDNSTLEWTNYFKAGLQGALNLAKGENPKVKPPSMQVMVDGTVPSGGGLSSSAAFVCASALAVLRVLGMEDVTKRQLVELAIVSERAVGVNSGGMDQAASVFSVKGDALSVSFSPSLHAEALKFPDVNPPMTFMVAQTFVAADKHIMAPEQYNLRVVECTLAAEVLAAKKKIHLKDDKSPLGRSLRGFQLEYFADSSAGSLSESDQLKQLLGLLDALLPQLHGYSRQEIADALSMSVADLEQRFMTKFKVRAERFMLKQRALHVWTEALRVIDFRKLLKSPHRHDSSLFARLGLLMDATQRSCRDIYDCSCPELDQLCELAKAAGSYGSRLTGAGWGGCTVHLVPKDRVEAIQRAWEDGYYKGRDPSWTREKTEKSGAVVASEPGSGSAIILLNK